MDFYTGFIVMLYFLAIAFLGWLGYRRTKNSDDYLVGGRQMNSAVMALSYGATFISASAIVGFGGVAATFGMGIQWLCFLNMFVGVVVAFIFFGRRTRRIGAQLHAGSFPQFLGLYYKSRAIQVLTGAVVFLGMPLYAAVVLKGGAVFIEEIFQIDYHLALLVFTLIIAAYVVAGGMKGVMYTDALQAVIMFVCMAFLAAWLYRTLGMGFTEANRALTDMAPLVPEALHQVGHRGWTAMPAFHSPQWYTLVTSFVLGVGIGCLAQPQLVVRFMTVESNRQLNRGVMIGCIFLAITVGVIYHAGALSNLYFFRTEGKLAGEMVQDMDKIIPLFISHAMPGWFSVIFMLCILSASMSTLSAQFHTMGAAAGADIYGALARKAREGKNRSTLVIRLAVLVSILLSYVICYTLSEGIIARGTSLFMGVCASTFLPAYFCSLYCPRVDRRAALWSMAVGLAGSSFAMLFLHRKESEAIGLCRALFGQDCLLTTYPLDLVDPIVWSFPLSCIAIALAARLYRKAA